MRATGRQPFGRGLTAVGFVSRRVATDAGRRPRGSRVVCWAGRVLSVVVPAVTVLIIAEKCPVVIDDTRAVRFPIHLDWVEQLAALVPESF